MEVNAASTVARLALVALVGGALGLPPTLPAIADTASSGAKVLRVGTSGDYSPFSSSTPSAARPLSSEAAERAERAGTRSNDRGVWTNLAQSHLHGFDIALARAFAIDRGYELEFVRFRWPELSRDLAAGRFDVAMSGITLRAERSILGRYTIPVAATHAVALTWKGSGIDTLEHLNRSSRTIAVNAGGHLEKVADQVFRRANVVALADNEAVRMALLDRAFDAVVTDNFEAQNWAAPARHVVALGPLSDDRKAFFLPADHGDLAAELDRWLMAKEKDGTLAKLRREYFHADGNESEDTATAEPLQALAEAVVERLALMPFVYDAKKRAGLPVEDSAREQEVLAAAQRAVDTAATQAGVARPDPIAVRLTFEVLMAMGRDAQNKLVERDERYRDSAVPRRKKTGEQADSSPNKGGDTGNVDGVVTAKRTDVPPVQPVAKDNPVATADPANHATKDAATANLETKPAGSESAAALVSPEGDIVFPTVLDRVDTRERAYDLASQLRPAIGRITDKIARALVALPSPLSSTQSRNALLPVLRSHGVDPKRVGELADALAMLSRPSASR